QGVEGEASGVPRMSLGVSVMECLGEAPLMVVAIDGRKNGRPEQEVLISMGSLYKQKGRDGHPGRIWWAKWYQHGRAMRESTGTADWEQAKLFLKGREGRVALGQPILPRAERITYEEIVTDLRQHYVTTGSRDIQEAGWRLAHLDPFFRGCRVATIGPA